MSQPRDPFIHGLFPVSPLTHDQGLRWLFDLATVLLMLNCRPGDRVLDLGAGSGFSSEMLARFGYDVVAIDPDLTALANNRRRVTYDRQRIDGTVAVAGAIAETLPFASASFDGVVGLNVLHHVPDLDAALTEIARVLRPGCIAAFCEPGLDHLQAAETRRAMQEHGEGDRPFDVISFLRRAKALGFSHAMLSATLQSPLRMVPVEEIDLFASGHHHRAHLTPAGVLDELHRRHAYGALIREGTRPHTSKNPGVLAARIDVGQVPGILRRGQPYTFTARVTNTGDSLWLAAPHRFGGFVTFGCKLLTDQHRLVSDSVGRTFLAADVEPGATAAVTVKLILPESVRPGRYTLRFDLVNELRCWFSDLSNEPPPHAAVVVD